MRALLVAALALTLAGATPALAQTPPADTILVNGKIVTVDDRFTIAQAVAIKGQRIVAVGSNAEIGKLRGRRRAPSSSRPHRHPRADRQPFALDTRRRARRAALRRRHDAQAGAGPADRARARAPSPANGSRRSAAGRRSSSPTSRAASRSPSSTASRRTIRWCCSRSISTAISTARRSRRPASTRRRPTRPTARSRRTPVGKPTGVVRGAGGVAFVAAKIPHGQRGLARQHAQVRGLSQLDRRHRLVDAAAAA